MAVDRRSEVFVGDESDAVGVEREIAGAGFLSGCRPQCRTLFGDDLKLKNCCDKGALINDVT